MIETAILFILITLLQFFSGWAILQTAKIDTKPIIGFCLALLLGMLVCSLIPLLMELFYIRITVVNFLLCFVLITVLLNYKFKNNIAQFKNQIKCIKYNIIMYEWVFLIGIAGLLLIGIWRCFYTAPTARDIIVGAELLAKYAIQDGHIISSVFTDNIRLSSNNPFKPPYVLNMQIVYKLMGFEFGKIWLSQNVILFIILLYQILKEKIHPILTGFLLLCFIAIPDMYAYTFIIMYDYSHAIYFCIAVYLLHQHLKSRRVNMLILSSLFFAGATFIRSETIYFLVLGIIILLFSKRRGKLIEKIKFMSILLAPSLMIHFLWFGIFMNLYMPVTYDISSQFNTQWTKVSNIFAISKSIVDELLIGKTAESHYAYFLYLGFLMLSANLFFLRDFRNWYYLMWILTIPIGYIFLAHWLPLIEVDSTVKRGFFKLFPLILFYLAESKLLSAISQKIVNWENKP